jgi:hypothetical protein
VIKRQFSHVKVRYRGLAKNAAQKHALSNLWMKRRQLGAVPASVRLQGEESVKSATRGRGNAQKTGADDATDVTNIFNLHRAHPAVLCAGYP